jgi:hypothetical protein
VVLLPQAWHGGQVQDTGDGSCVEVTAVSLPL